MRVYTAGPMTGLPQFNYPAFLEAAALLRNVGYDVVSPAELDNDFAREAALASPNGLMSEFDAAYRGPLPRPTWGDFLSRDVKLLADGDERGRIDGIIVLEGWESSKGARLETFVGAMAGMPVESLQTWDVNGAGWRLRPVARLDLIRAWASEPNLFIYETPYKYRANVRGTHAQEVAG